MKIILLIIGLLLCSVSALAADFTVDDRSYLHFGASATIGAGVNSLLILTDTDKNHRRVISAVSCLAVGSFKEFVIDAYPDYGDLTFNLIGCGVGIALTEGLTLSLQRNGINISGVFQ